MIDSLKILFYLFFVLAICLIPVYLYRKKITEVFLVVSVLIFFFFLNKDFLWGNIGVYHDTLGHEYLLLFFKQWIDKGLPFGWNPYLNGGEPFYLWSNSFLWVQWALFCGINRILQLDSHILFNIYWVFQFANFSIGCLLLFLVLYDNFKAALLVFIALLLSGMFLINLGQPTGLRIIYYFPYILFGIMLALKRESPYGLALSIVFMGIALNHYIPHYLILCVGIFLFFLFVFDSTQFQKFIAIVKFRYRLMLVSVIISIMAATPAIYLYFEMQDYVSPTRGSQVVGGGINPEHTGLQPCVNAPLWAYRVILDKKTWYRANIHHAYYFGIVSLLLIPLALFRWRNRYVLTLLASTLVVLFLGTGNEFAGYRFLIRYVPSFNMIRHSFGLAQFVGLFLLCLAGFGIKEWMADGSPIQKKSKQLYLTLLVYAVLVLFSKKSHLILFGSLSLLTLSIWLSVRQHMIHHQSFITNSTGRSVGKVQRSNIESIFYIVIILFLVIDLTTFYIPGSKKGLRKKPYTISEIVYPFSRTYYTQESLFHLPPDITPLILKKSSLTHPQENFVMFRNKRLHDMFHFSNTHGKMNTFPPNYFPGIDGPIIYLTQNVNILPRDVSDEGLIAAIYRDGLGHRTGLQRRIFFRETDIDFSHNIMRPNKRAEFTNGSIEYLKVDDPNHLELMVNAPEDGYLARLENYHSGWEAFVDGEKTRIYRANYAFQSIRISKGTHRVIFKFSTIYPYLFRIHIGCVIFGWIIFNYYLYHGWKGNYKRIRR